MIGAARVCSGPVWCTDPCSVNCGARPGNLGLVGGEEGGSGGVVMVVMVGWWWCGS